MDDTESVTPDDGIPSRVITMAQIIGYNIRRWRKVAELTQEELGRRIGWTNTAVSAAEKSWDGRRPRQFTADEMVTLALGLGVGVPAMLLPPDDDGAKVRYVFDGPRGPWHMGTLLELLLPETPAGPEVGKEWDSVFTATRSNYEDAERGRELAEILTSTRPYSLERARWQREALLALLTDLDRIVDAIETEGER